jgi:mono/diheme cytochrome c family protein
MCFCGLRPAESTFKLSPVLSGDTFTQQEMRMRERIWRRISAGAIILTCAVNQLAFGAPAPQPPAAVAPVVPGYVRLKDEAKASLAEQGEVLLGELNCLQCHAAPNQKRVLTKGAPDLTSAGSRMTPQYIRAYLLDNHGMKPGTTMPDLFHASEAQSKDGAVDFLTNYLVSLGGPIKPSGEEGSSIQVDQGRALFQKVGCAACHAPDKTARTTIPSIPFPKLAEKTTVENLEAFLLDPTKVRPGGRMPSLNLSKDEARDIAVYLLKDQLDNPQNKDAGPARISGLKYIYYEVNAHTAAIEKIDPLRPKSQGKIDRFALEFPGHRKDNFAVKFSGAIHIPKAGKYTFFTNSDDGSCLYIGKQKVVDNDGVHPAGEKSGQIELAEGDQPITVTYFQGGNDFVLNVSWEGPGLAKQEIPSDVLFSIGGKPLVPLGSEAFTVDPQKAQMGKMMFSAIGCAACHKINGVSVMKERKALTELNADAPTGCLGDQIPKSVPNYRLSADQRAALKAAISDVKSLDTPADAKHQVMQMAAAFNCFACHVRDKVGGPTADRAPLFVMSAEFDMGDEGRFPPRLTGVGAKLLPTALQEIIFENRLHVRPVLATRMPSFHKEAAGGIVDALVKADEVPQKPAPAFNQLSAKDGRTLFGTKGLGCVNCHGINGIKSLGMPAPDLGTMHDRLTYTWYHDLMVDPAHVNPGTRMPGFWVGGDVALKTIAGGTEEGQIAALWNYLSLGKSMALPSGLTPAAGDELIPTDAPIVHRTFFSGAGNRSIAVGFPEMVHVVFDADVVRMAKAWKGRFFDARGMWEGRGGQHMGPLGTDIIDLPPGPSFAVLASPTAEWPLPKPTYKDQVERDLGGQFKGYVLDKEDRPIFHYILDGIDIQEQPLPVLKTGGADLERKFTLSSKGAVKDLYFLAAQGKQIESKSPGEWTIDGKLTLKLGAKAEGLGQPVIRDSAGGNKQLLIPVSFNNGSASFNVEMSW